MKHVAHNTVVSLRYCMRNSQGDILENRMQSAPVEYVHGSGAIMPALQQSLAGLQPGDTANIAVNNQMDFQLDSSFYFDVVIDDVRAATEEEIIKGKPAISKTAPGECGPGCIC